MLQYHVEIFKWPQILETKRTSLKRRIFLTLKEIQVPPTPTFFFCCLDPQLLTQHLNYCRHSGIGISINIYIASHPGYDPSCCFRMINSSVSTEAWEFPLFHWGISIISAIYVMWLSCLVYWSASPLRLFCGKNIFNKTLEWLGWYHFLQNSYFLGSY
jgi:hypothetical protein